MNVEVQETIRFSNTPTNTNTTRPAIRTELTFGGLMIWMIFWGRRPTLRA